MWDWFGGNWWAWLFWGGLALIIYTLLTGGSLTS